ncbi:unnamed protein product [Staurois parvus]|uniref:Uncharacterized protein n=1 Tax=Staurois parvus TaxID=386267 RepID=A0ABN9GQI5_9NEOB|nr:unnamed protein product [Staurois parvus]
MGPLYRLLMLLPGPESPHGSMYGSHCAVSIATHFCHVPLSGLLTLLVCSIFVIGCCRLRASHCCCQARNLPWAPVPPPHAAAGPESLMGSLYGSHCCCLHRHTLPWVCHFQVSLHTAASVFHFLS